jgi:hypothetical protein
MAFSSNPKILRDGLILNLDAADVTSRRTINLVEVMVVGGGGGGGMDMGGGGGGGGVLYEPKYVVTPGVGVTVTVGAGGFGAPAGSGGYRTDGAGPQPGGHQFTVSATNGGNSAFGTLVALGGGFGGSSYFGYTPNYGIGATGASGGGNSGYTAGNTTTAPQGTPGQGFKGGNAGGGSYYSGGGGGAGAPGADGPNTPHGGAGITIPRMSPFHYGGGGGGASYSSGQGGNGGIGGGGGGANGTTVGGAGLNNGSPGGGGGGEQWANTPGGNAGANTGGGGGGSAHYNANNKGGEGGSGIVIVRYPGPQAATGGTYTFVNGVSFHTFTSSGTFTPFNVDTIWYDTSGFGHNATLHGGCSFSTIKGVPAITLDGTNDWIGNTTLTGGWSDFTLELMFYHNGLDQGESYGVLSMGANGNYGPMFYCHTSCMGSHYFPDSPSGAYPGGMGYWSNNTWNIFTWVFKNTVTDNTTGDFKTYINGVYNSGTSNFNFHNGGMGRGSNGYALGTYSGGSAVYKGSFAIFRVYNRELSAAEVARNYSLIKTRFGL